MNKAHIVCLGGGIGTVNLIKGVKKVTKNITVVVSLADEGGSSGRLRRLYRMFPPGDLVSCMAALTNDETVAKLLTYRFPGNRYGKDNEIYGHKLGNLIMTAARSLTNNIDETVSLFQRIFAIEGQLLPATKQVVSISAKTVEGKTVVGEETIDLGKYNGKRVLDRVFLHPKNAQAPDEVVSAIRHCDLVFAGPGDLYTTVLPVLIVPNVKKALITSDARRIFVLNIANKPFETRGYTVADYVRAVERHLGAFPFDIIMANRNTTIPIPPKYKYTYVSYTPNEQVLRGKIIGADLVDESFPLYHSPEKLATELKKIV